MSNQKRSVHETVMARLNIPESNHTKTVSTPSPISMQEERGVVGPKYTRVHHKAKCRSFPKSETDGKCGIRSLSLAA